jgi:hypothetical protein
MSLLPLNSLHPTKALNIIPASTEADVRIPEDVLPRAGHGVVGPGKDLSHVERHDGTDRDGNARHERPWDGHADDRRADWDACGHQLDDGAALYGEDGRVHGRHEDHLLVRRQDG